MTTDVSSLPGGNSRCAVRPRGRGRGSVALRCAAVWLVFALGVTTAAFGAADDSKIIFPGTARANAPAAGSVGSLGSVTLLIGLALAAAGAWFVWRGRTGLPVGRDTRALQLNETRSLGNRQYLVVASYEDKKFLLGVCPGRIDLLAPLHDSANRGKPGA